jgi:hypothetical protein
VVGLPERSLIVPTRTPPYRTRQTSRWASGSRRRVTAGMAIIAPIQVTMRPLHFGPRHVNFLSASTTAGRSATKLRAPAVAHPWLVIIATLPAAADRSVAGVPRLRNRSHGRCLAQ